MNEPLVRYELSGISFSEVQQTIAELVTRLRDDQDFRQEAAHNGLDLQLVDELLETAGGAPLFEAKSIDMGVGPSLMGIAFAPQGAYVAQNIWDSCVLPSIQRENGPDSIGEAQGDISYKSESEDSPRIYPVYYGTNRNLRRSTTGQLLEFGSERAPLGTVHFGKCNVAVPRSHRFTQVAPSWWRRLLACDRGRLEITERHQTDQFQFWKDLNQDLTLDANDIFVFIHGYNVSFDEAAIRAAQLGVDLKVPGITAFFSWPSKGELEDYTRDEAAIAGSEAALTEFLVRLSTETSAARIHILAHSMGNRGLLRAIQRIAYRSALPGSVKLRFGHLILAAGDEDVDLFKDLSPLFRGMCQRVTVYSSPADRALRASRWLHGHSRFGFTSEPPPIVVEGIDTVDVPSFNLLNLGHGYFASAESVLHDMFELIYHNSDPIKRQRIDRATAKGTDYWLIRR